MEGKKKILIIDDEDHARKAFRIHLERFDNVEVLEAASGRRGIELAKTEKPDIIILDNMMPGIPGEQAVRHIRISDEIKSIPVIMLTAMQLTEDEINFIKMDVNEFLTKPVNPWELQKSIEKYIGPLKGISLE
jgi:DNA-binding response OmpR family regulator